ncbi:hypothetical protein F441_19782 [Phytophthora nicotianae CJ01A1]|nr:hypothetical protein F441_19782 [Phytophthora nicotianae CJ01A1]
MCTGFPVVCRPHVLHFNAIWASPVPHVALTRPVVAVRVACVQLTRPVPLMHPIIIWTGYTVVHTTTDPLHAFIQHRVFQDSVGCKQLIVPCRGDPGALCISKCAPILSCRLQFVLEYVVIGFVSSSPSSPHFHQWFTRADAASTTAPAVVPSVSNPTSHSYSSCELIVCALPVEEDIFKAQDTTSDTHQGDEDLDNCLGVHFTQEFKNKPPGD